MIDLLTLFRLAVDGCCRTRQLLDPTPRMRVVLRMKPSHVGSGTAREIQRADVVRALKLAQTCIPRGQLNRTRVVAAKVVSFEVP